METADINYLAVLITAMVPMALGFVWYSLKVLGAVWMKEVGLTMKDIGNGPSAGYVLALLGSLVQSYVLARFIEYAGAHDWAKGAMIGLWLSVGLVASAIGINYIFAHRSPKLWLIDAGYFVVSLTLMGALLAQLS